MSSPARQSIFTLQRKFLIAAIGLTLIVTFLVVTFELWTVRRTLWDQTRTQGASIADTVASTAGYYVIFDLSDDLRAIIDDLVRHSEVEYAEFLTAAGGSLAASHPVRPAGFERIPRDGRPRQQTVDVDGRGLHLFVRPFFESRQAAEAEVPEAQGYFYLAVNDSSVEHAVRDVLVSSLPIALLAILAGSAIALAGARFIVRPVLDVVAAATRISSGDLTRRTSITSRDEMGSLGRAFNDMAINLERTVGKLVQSQGKLKSVSETVGSRSGIVISSVDEQRRIVDEAYGSLDELAAGIRRISKNVETLSASSEETSSSILEMVASIEEVSRHTDSLYGSVDETASATTQMVTSIGGVDQNVEYLQTFVTDTSSAMNEMNASITQVQANAARSYDLALAVAEAAETGMAAVRQTIDGMEQVRNAVVEANHVIGQLGERSAEIGKILNVIEDVAEQTNLLALNAAILAAQAGEHGKGFSVVAGQIRQLSERTASSTRDIAALIRSVQSEVSNAGRTMTDGSTMVEKGVELSHDAGTALNRILESATKSSEMGKEIATATQEQAKGSQAVATALERVQDLVRQINSATRQQAAGSAHILNAVETMREVTRYVRQAMEEQRSGSGMIAKAAERMIEMVHEIFEITASQSQQSETIVRTMQRVREIAEGNRSSAAEMSQSIGLLSEAIRELDDEVKKFRIRA